MLYTYNYTHTLSTDDKRKYKESVMGNYYYI